MKILARMGLALALSARATEASQAPADASAPTDPPPAPPSDPPPSDAPPAPPGDPPPAPPADPAPAASSGQPTVPPAHSASPPPPSAPPPPPASPTAPAPPFLPSAEPSAQAPASAAPANERSAVPPPPASTAVPSFEEKDHSNGLFGPFRLGPMVGGGLPSLLTFGGALKLTPYFGAGLNVGLVPEVSFSYYGEATISYQEYSIYGHIHPLGGGFFVGSSIGYARVHGNYETQIDLAALPGGLSGSIPYRSEASVQTLVLTPELGYIVTFRSGFTFGVDAGIQIPVAPSEIEFQNGVPPGLPPALVDQYLGPNDARVRSTLERVGRTVLPTFHLRMGWLL